MMQTTSIALALIVLSATFASAATPFNALKGTYKSGSKPTGPRVSTKFGEVEGLHDSSHDVNLFLGIPYAKAPVDSLRFMPPESPNSWQGVLKTKRFGAACPQLEEQHAVSEDCLSLNIWTPRLESDDDSALLPVMVFIHGGGFVEGTSSSSLYDGTHFASRGVVYVSISYRLGFLGWIDLSGLGDNNYVGAANNGLRDQMLAFQWIQDNIAAFGGDKNQVTAFGQSSGATSITAMLATPNPENLFQRAIIMSGGTHLTHTKNQSQEISRWFVDLAQEIYEEGDSIDMPLLMDASSHDLVELQSVGEYYSGILDQQLFAPTVDGVLITKDPLTLLQEGNAKNVDVLIGSTQHEINMWLDILDSTPERNFGTAPWPLPLQEPALERAPLNRDAEVLINNVLNDDFFIQNCAACNPTEKLLLYFSHLMVHNDIIDVANALSKHNPNTYMYRFNWISPDHYEWGVPQGLDLGFVFDALHETEHVTGDVQRAKSMLADTMAGLWSHFALTGNFDGLKGMANNGNADERLNRDGRATKFWFDWPRYTDGEGNQALIINDLSHGRIETRRLDQSPYQCSDEEIAEHLPNLCRKQQNWTCAKNQLVAALEQADVDEEEDATPRSGDKRRSHRKHNKGNKGSHEPKSRPSNRSSKSKESNKSKKSDKRKPGYQMLADMVKGLLG